MMRSIDEVSIEREEDHDHNSFEFEHDEVVYTDLKTADDSFDDHNSSNNNTNPSIKFTDDVSKKQHDNDYDDDDYDNNDNANNHDDLLEPFPERNYQNIDHDRRPEAYVDAEEEEDEILRPGDHIFVYKSFGMFSSYQKHGIVLSVDPDDDDNVSIVTFYHKNKNYEPNRRRRLNIFHKQHRSGNQRPTSGDQCHAEDNETDESLLHRTSSKTNGHILTPASNNSSDTLLNQKFTPSVRAESIYTFSANSKGRIHKVKYKASFKNRLLSRGGTVTCCSADEIALVLARLKYLLECPGRLPEFHMMAANGQAGGAAVGGVLATNVMLWAPVPGFWGSMGYIWFVPATVAYPILVPVLIGFGLASLVPLEALRRFRKKWAQISTEMNKAFWTIADPDIRECYFSSTASADDDWTKRFFGDHLGDKKEGTDADEDKGKYMPLGEGTIVNDSFDSTDDVDEDDMMKQISAEYGLASAGNSSEQEFQEHWNQAASTSVKDRWQNMFGRKKESKISSGYYDSGEEDSKRPLTDDATCKELM